MSSYLDLVKETIVPPTKVYFDEKGEYRGSQVDIYPAMRLLIRSVAWVYFIKWFTWPLWGAFGYWVVKWWCKKNDKAMKAEDPTGWPHRRRKLLLEFKLWMYLWIGYMTYGFLTDWGTY